ncbi:hypothetical protein ACFXTN_040407 [Malus domestica]
MAVARLSTTKLILINCPTSLARSVSCPTKICPTKACPSKPEKKAEVRHIPSTDAILPGELCARPPGDSCDEQNAILTKRKGKTNASTSNNGKTVRTEILRVAAVEGDPFPAPALDIVSLFIPVVDI